MIEACVAYIKAKPIMLGSCDVADKLANSYIDDRCLIKIFRRERSKKGRGKGAKPINLIIDKKETYLTIFST